MVELIEHKGKPNEIVVYVIQGKQGTSKKDTRQVVFKIDESEGKMEAILKKL